MANTTCVIIVGPSSVRGHVTINAFVLNFILLDTVRNCSIAVGFRKLSDILQIDLLRVKLASSRSFIQRCSYIVNTISWPLPFKVLLLGPGGS
jgi:hypothetical protein